MMTHEIKPASPREKMRPSKLYLSLALIVMSSAVACEKPSEVKMRSETFLNASAQQNTKNIEYVAQKTRLQNHLTKHEKTQLETGFDLSQLGMEDRNDFLRRLSLETGQAKRSGDLDLARYYAKKELGLRRDIVDNFSESYFDELSLAISLSALGQIEQDAGNYVLARDYLKDSLVQLQDNPPKTENKSLWQRLVMWRHRDLGHLEKELKDYSAAQKSYESYLNYVVKNPSHDDYLYDHAEAYYFLGDLFLQQASWPEAADNYERSIRLLNKHISQAMERDELQTRRRLAQTYGKFVYTAYVQSQEDDARIASENYINASQLVLRAPGAQRSDQLHLATAYYYAAKYTNGKDDEYYQSALDIFNRLKEKSSLPQRYGKIVDDINSLLAE